MHIEYQDYTSTLISDTDIIYINTLCSQNSIDLAGGTAVAAALTALTALTLLDIRRARTPNLRQHPEPPHSECLRPAACSHYAMIKHLWLSLSLTICNVYYISSIYPLVSMNRRRHPNIRQGVLTIHPQSQPCLQQIRPIMYQSYHLTQNITHITPLIACLYSHNYVFDYVRPVHRAHF